MLNFSLLQANLQHNKGNWAVLTKVMEEFDIALIQEHWFQSGNILDLVGVLGSRFTKKLGCHKTKTKTCIIMRIKHTIPN